MPDLIVIGLGAMGAAVALHASQLGMDVLGIDQHEPPHALGSTHAETRITRLAVGEGPQYLPFVKRSHDIWRELERRTSTELLHQCGGLIVTGQEPVPGQRWEDFVVETAAIAAGANIPYDIRDPAAVRRDHPWLQVPDSQRIGFEATAGLVMVARGLTVQLQLAVENGATIRTNERVTGLMPDPKGVAVTTDAGSHWAPNVVLATGPWMPELAAPAHGRQLRVTRQVVYWFEADDLEEWSTSRIPFVMWIGETDEDYVSLFPAPPGGTAGVKILGEQFLDATDPATVDRTVTDEEINRFFDTHVAPKFSGIRRTCLRAEVCLYTNTSDDHFLIDTDPRSDRIMVMSPCSGHGFKHSTALGEAVAQRIATGTSTLSLEPFGSAS